MTEATDPDPLIESFGRNLQKCAEDICPQQAICALTINVTGTVDPLDEQSLMISDLWGCISDCPMLENEELRMQAREQASDKALFELGLNDEVDYTGMYDEQEL